MQEKGKKKKKNPHRDITATTKQDRILYKRNTYENRKFKIVNSKK